MENKESELKPYNIQGEKTYGVDADKMREYLKKHPFTLEDYNNYLKRQEELKKILNG